MVADNIIGEVVNVDRIAAWINRSKTTQKVLRAISDNAAVFSTISSFAVASTVRPAMIMGITPNKEDAKYGAASSISSSLVELIGGYAILKPITKAIDNSSKKLYDMKGTAFFHNKEMLRRYKTVANRLYKMPTIFVTSLVRFSMVTPIAAMLAKFGLAKNNKENIK